ncbi:MAG: hypothetical protein AAB225_22285 [Acidobacteriota bacterium]
MRLSVKGCALAAGILWALAILFLTLSSLWRGAGEHLGLLAGVYFGYCVSYLGCLVGLVYGFATGALAGALFAWLYNRVAPTERANSGG